MDWDWEEFGLAFQWYLWWRKNLQTLIQSSQVVPDSVLKMLVQPQVSGVCWFAMTFSPCTSEQEGKALKTETFWNAPRKSKYLWKCTKYTEYVTPMPALNGSVFQRIVFNLGTLLFVFLVVLNTSLTISLLKKHLPYFTILLTELWVWVFLKIIFWFSFSCGCSGIFSDGLACEKTP